MYELFRRERRGMYTVPSKRLSIPMGTQAAICLHTKFLGFGIFAGRLTDNTSEICQKYKLILGLGKTLRPTSYVRLSVECRIGLERSNCRK